MRNVVNYPKEINSTSWFSNANLKAYYRFNENNLLVDSSAGTHTLTAIGVPVQGTPKFGGAVGLGTSQAFSAVQGADFQPAGNFSVSAWIRTTKLTTAMNIFTNWASPTNYAGIQLTTTTANKIALYSYRNTGTTQGTDWQGVVGSITTMANGNWHHVVGTYDGAKLHVYVDGAEDGTGVAWTNAAGYQATNKVRVGCLSESEGGVSNPFQGSLDEVSFFPSDALTLAQVQSLYANSITHASNTAIKALASAVYLFEDGAQLTDSSTGGTHTLTAIGTPTTLTTKFGGSVFLGNSSAYSAVDHADFQPTGNFTVGAWVKVPTAGSYEVFTSYSANTNRAGFRLGVSGGSCQLASAKNTGTVSGVDHQTVFGGSVADNNWHFIVGTWDGSYLRAYVDGVSVTTPVAWAYAPAYAATNYVRVGCYNLTGTNANLFSGQLDDVFLLNGTALTDAQIALLYNGRNPITQARTVATTRKTLIPYCLDFDGTDDGVTITSAALRQLTAFTYECWIYHDVLNDQGMPFATNAKWWNVTSANVLQGNIACATTAANSVSTTTISATTWTHIALSFDNAGDRKVHLYKNGVEVTYSEQTAGVGTMNSDGTTSFYIGKYSSAGWEFDGKIAQLRVWNKQLNVADILLHAQNARDITCVNTAACTYATNCLAHFPMDVENGTGTILINVKGINGTFKAAGEPAWSTNPNIPAARNPVT